MNRKAIVAVLFGLLVAFTPIHLQAQSNPDGDSAADPGTIPVDTEEDILNLYQRIPTGINYASLRSKIPSLSDLSGEFDPSRKPLPADAPGLTQAFLPVTLFSYPFEIEFNFKDAQLYAFYFFSKPMPSEDGDRMFQDLVYQFSERYGTATITENQEEPAYSTRVASWSLDDFSFRIVDNISVETHTIAMSFTKK